MTYLKWGPAIDLTTFGHTELKVDFPADHSAVYLPFRPVCFGCRIFLDQNILYSQINNLFFLSELLLLWYSFVLPVVCGRTVFLNLNQQLFI